MADDKTTSKDLERNYNVPLRKEWLKVPRYKRSKKAVKALREFLEKHMKSEDVRIGAHANEFIWKHGIKNPPHHVSVTAVKDSEGVVRAELEGKDFKGAVKSVKKEEKATGLKGKLQEALGKKDKPEEEVVEEKEESKETAKSIEEKTTEEKKKPSPKKTPAKKKSPAKKSTAKKKTSK